MSRYIAIHFTLAGLLFMSMPGTAEPFSAEALLEALTSGKPEILFNYRFENVNDPTTAKDAYASTLRSVLTYETGRFYGLAVHVQLEDVRVIGNELYNDGGSNGKTRYAVVVDPEGFEVNEAYVSFGKLENMSILKDTEFRFGRQLITYRKAPFHRFIGPVVWRQNWQTFDGFTASNFSLEDTAIHLGYIYNINRIFGEDNPTRGLHDQGVDGFLFNIQHAVMQGVDLELYSYLLDFDTSSATPVTAFYQSTQTYGGRLQGDRKITENLKGLYALEYARQLDYAQNPNSIDSYYFLGELGLQVQLHHLVDSITVKVTHERLSGDGGVDRFTTPLATLHPYQGWADKFLNTPGDGILDTYLTFTMDVLGAKFTAVYHDFNSDEDDYDYGSEIDLVLSRAFGKYFTAGLKYADYSADGNALNVARNSASGQAFDINKFWAWIQFRY